MGRAFEYRKARKFKRWAAMSQAFTRIGKEIAMSVKAGGPDPTTNARLRLAIQNSKIVNMPKANVENAIKRATSKDEKDYEEIVYEGYGPHGVAILVETATDNPTRTVANLRMYFSRCGGALGNSGSVSFMFDRKGEFRFPMGNLDLEELELELIDHGADDIQVDGDEVYVYTSFEDFGTMQKALEERGIEVTSAGLQRFPQVTKELTEAQQEDVERLLEKIEEDEDVQQVFHTMS
jgi:YebC/PmpR family DNA-binding regulatory protein